MCDLIDLNSPSAKGLAVGKLASPLIPVPVDSPCHKLNAPVTSKRDSLENNPFDMMLHKTMEYVQKKNDPFEVTLERALRSKRRSIPAVLSGNIAEDLALKQRKQTKASKLNSSLDEALMDEKKEKNVEVDNIASDDSMRVNLNETSVIESPSIQNGPVSCIKGHMPVVNVESADLSILDQSSLNDTLSDIVCDNLVRKQFALAEVDLKVPKLRRSHSQGETLPLRKLHQLNRASQSIMDGLRPCSLNSRSMLSNASSRQSDPLNEGFLKAASSESSVFSNLSHLSGASKPNSGCTNRLSLAVTNRTTSRSFLESYSSSEIAYNAKKGEKAEIIDETIYSISPISLRSVNSVSSAANQKGHVSFSDLVERLNKLKTNPVDHDASQTSSNGKSVCRSFCGDQKEFNAAAEKSAESENKLVDVDVFTPEENCSTKHCRSSVSDTSSDSVFTESGGKGNRRILQEAKAMAKMFEEMAHKNSPSSSVDDLMNSNPLWTSELLPAFEDEDAVGNLIEFSASPKNPDQDKGNRGQGGQSKDTDGTRAEENWKELEAELCLGSTPAERKVAAATLLADLRKLFEAERNKEASSLIANLEKALGVQRESNAALLASCLETTNDLARSPKKSGESQDIVKNVEGMERSQEENFVEEAVAANVNLNTDSSKDCDTSKKYVKSVDSDPEEVREKENVSTNLREASVEKVNEVEKSSRSQDGNDSGSFNRTIANELLTNLSRLLNGQVEEELTQNILRNLGTVLNIASSNYVESKTKTDTNHEIQRTPKGSRLRSEKRHSSALSISARLSTDLDSKRKSASSLSRRRSSASQSPPIRNAPTPLLTKSKGVSRVRDTGRKRVSSDPGSLDADRRIPEGSPTEVPGNEKGRRSKLPAVLEREKRPPIADAVKNKLKKKPETEAVNKRGPMKALLPVGNMHKRESLGRRAAVGTVTPPKPQRMISSTPRSSTAPVASSTPDNGHQPKPRTIIVQARSPRQRSSWCDISPVSGTNGTVTSTTSIRDNQLNPSRKPSSPKRLTPKRRQPESSIPKPASPSFTGKSNSSFGGKPCDRPSDSPQRPRVSRSTPVTPSKTAANARNLEKLHQSPLRDSNKLTPNVKPFNLITKLRRHSGQAGGGLMEKENNYV